MSNYITFSRLGSYGHLGNQLFQFSIVYSYAKQKNKTIAFTIDKQNSMLFKCFNLDCNISFTNSLMTTSSYVEKQFSYDEGIWNKNFDDLIGYFQSEKYFKQYTNELRQTLKFKNKSEELKDSVFIHVRRGDYLKYPDVHPLCSEEYYSTAIEIIRNKYGSNVKFVVFSDDINAAVEYNCFKQNNITFSNNDAFSTLYKMKSCMSGIIANSSFSWWGAWLIDNTNKTIIAPNRWFGSKGPKDTSDIYCSEWIKI